MFHSLPSPRTRRKRTKKGEEEKEKEKDQAILMVRSAAFSSMPAVVAEFREPGFTLPGSTRLDSRAARKRRS